MKTLFKSAAMAVSAAAMTLAIASPALADAKSEAFVEKNANAVLQTLNQPNMTDAQRTAKFAEYMNTFADMDQIARGVVSPNGRAFSPADFKRYEQTFNEYAMAVYEEQLDKYRGEAIEVTGSRDLKSDKDGVVFDSVVFTRLKSSVTGETLKLGWRVIKQKDSDFYKVRDVSICFDGGDNLTMEQCIAQKRATWLAIEQREQFIGILQQNNNDVDVLIERIREMIDKMRQDGTRKAEADASAPSNAG